MDIIVVGVKKISMTQYKISKWVIWFIQILGVPAKDIEDGPTTMHTCGHIAIGIEISLSTRIFQTLDFITFWVIYECEVRVGVAARFIEVQSCFCNA